jgi:hypothetical protein
MRSIALIALACFGVLALTLPAAAQNSVSVAKQPAPQRLAPAQTQDAALQAHEAPAEPQPATPAADSVAPVEVPIERYKTMRSMRGRSRLRRKAPSPRSSG